MIERDRVDWMYAVPTMMHRIWRLPERERQRFDLSSLRVVFHMAAPCPPWLKRSWIDWLGGERILELYGGTEAQAITFHAIVQAAGPLTPAVLEEFLRSKLTKYKRPRTYEFVSEPLRGDDGKVRRSALRAQRLATTAPRPV